MKSVSQLATRRTRCTAGAATGTAALLTILLAVLAGCVRYVERPIDADRSARTLVERSLDDPGLAAFVRRIAAERPETWPPESWGLAELTLAALYFQPDLDVARGEWATARAGRRTATAVPNPVVNVTPGFNTTAGTPSPWILTSLLDLTIETGGKRGARMDEARYEAEAARLRTAAVAWDVLARVRSSLEACASATEQRRLLESQVDLYDEHVRRTDERFADGAVSAFERSQVHMTAEAARLSLRDAEQMDVEARIGLAAAIGIAPEALDGISLAFTVLDARPSIRDLGEARSDALHNRADLLAMLADYASAEAALRLEIGRQYPDLHLGPGYEYDQGDDKWSLGPGFEVPVFNRNRGPIAAAEARRVTLEARFDALQLDVIVSVDRAINTYRAALRKAADADSLAGRALSQVARVEQMVDAGALSAADLVSIRIEAGDAAIQALHARSDLRRALGALEYAVQRPLDLPRAAWQSSPRVDSLTSTDSR